MNEKVIVSLTSYPYRFKKPEMISCLKTLVKQETTIPYKIVFNVFEDDIKEIPSELMLFIKENNIELYSCPLDIRSHKKYYYVMQKYKDLPIITVDDDIMYSKHLVEDLYSSYIKFPEAVSACYLYRMYFDKFDKLIPNFKKWDIKYEGYEPSFKNAFGSGGGTLFPPHCLDISEKNMYLIEKYITNDEILLKKWLNDAKVPVVKCKYDWNDEQHGEKSKCGSYLEAAQYATDSNSLWKSGNNVNMDKHIRNLLSDYDYKKMESLLKPLVIVTITSWKNRINDVIRTIESCNKQTRIPDVIYLNLSKSEFPKMNEEIPQEIIEYEKKNDNFKINWVDGPNTRTFKKVFPILKFCKNNDIIITMDDDIILNPEFVKSRVDDFNKHKCPITSAISFDKKLKSYKVNVGSLFTKRMLSNWERIVTDNVIKTHNDDRTYLYILYLNGYRPVQCSNYNIAFIVNRLSIKRNKYKLSSVVECKFGKEYDDFVEKDIMLVTGKSIFDSFAFFNKKISEEDIKRYNDVRKYKYDRILQLRKDIQNGNVVKVPCGNGRFVWKKIK